MHPFTVVKKIIRSPPKSSEDISMRMVLDQRRDNLAWREPPWCPMASPGSFSFVQVPSIPGKATRCLIGDLPDMYWTLELPLEMAEWFVFDGVNLKDLKHLLGKDYGFHVDFADGVLGVGMKVPLMG